jgi:vitamin B12 transporter
VFRNSFRRAAFISLAPLVLFAPAAVRADPAPQPSPTPPGEIGRVFTSDRHEEPIAKTTRATYVVDRAAIEARGERTIADAIADVPGVEIYRYGAFGAQADVFIRGASSMSALVLLDGVPVTPGSNEQLDLGSFSTAGVRRIEIVEGSGATLYGSNAVGGVINIITDVPRGTYLEASAGSLADRDLRVGVGDGRLGASFERHVASNDFNYVAIPVPGATPIPAGTRTNADAEQSAARVSYSANLGPDWNARLRFGADETHLGVPGSLIYGADAFSRQNVARDDAHLDITHTGATSATTLTLFGLEQKLDYVDPSFATENPTDDARTQVSLRNVVGGGPSTLTVGADFARESALLANIAQVDPVTFDVTGYATTGETQSQSALYAQEQYTLRGGMQINGGLRGENDAPLGSALTPSIGFGIPLATGTRLVINAGTAFRVPTIVDRYYPGYANPNLKPERSKDADVTLQSSTFLGGASLGFFLRDSANLIEVNSASVPQNVARASLRGLFGTVHTRPYHGIVTTLSVTDTYRAANLSPGVGETRLFFTPVFVSKLGLERAFGGGGLSVGAQANIFGPHVESTGLNPDGQTTVDVHVRGRLTRDAVLTVRAANIGNERYAPVLGYPAPGRTFEVELSTR